MFVSLSRTLEPTFLVRAAMAWPHLDRGTGDENGQDERAYENMQSRGLNRHRKTGKRYQEGNSWSGCLRGKRVKPVM